ncbi:MAG TPA: glycosyltransferase family 1 protein [Candidatus Saccharimonadales bacterium]
MHKPIKIIFDASPLLGPKTGVAYYIERLVGQLARQYPNDIELVGFYYNFLGRNNTANLPCAPNIRYRPIRFIPSKIVYQLRRFGIELPLELLAKERADFALFGNFLGYPSLAKTPAAPVVHDLTYLDLPDYVATKNRNDLTRFVPEQIKRSRFVITVSEFSKQKITDQYNTDPNHILVTPIPPEPPKLLDEIERLELLKKLGLSRPFLLFVGTVEPRKNIIALIDAYQQLPQNLQKHYTLVIAGRIGWNCDAEIARLQTARDQGLNVLHLGYVSNDERTALYQSAELFTTASHYEGFGMPVLEAMSFGLPCAVSDIPVFHEVASSSVLYFDQNNPKSIARTWQGILSDEKAWEKLADASTTQAGHFKWEAVARSVYEYISREVR